MEFIMGFDQSVDFVKEKLIDIICNTNDIDIAINAQKVLSSVNEIPAWLEVNPVIAMQKLANIEYSLGM